MKFEETPADGPVQISLGESEGKRIRLDRLSKKAKGSGVAGEITPESGGWIALLLRTIQARGENRRQDPRHEAIDREVWVGWWTGDHFGAESGRLANFSQGGARVILESCPPRKRSVWIYKQLGATLLCVRAKVVGKTPAPDGAFSVRVRFEGACPTAFSKAALSVRPVVRRKKADAGGEGVLER